MGITLGIKATHDGGFAVLAQIRDTASLLLSIEMEKLGNAERHARPVSMEQIAMQLGAEGFSPEDIDTIAFDGWWPDLADTWLETPRPTTAMPAQAPYIEPGDDLRDLPCYAGRITFAGRDVPTRAYPHSVGHVLGTYLASPHRDALVLVWDGGMPATVYRVSPHRAWREAVVLPITGNLYPVFCSLLSPFRDAWFAGPARKLADPVIRVGDPRWLAYNLSVPGKAMAYAGLGHVDEDAIGILNRHTPAVMTVNRHHEYLRPARNLTDDVAWVHRVGVDLARLGLDDATLMASFQEWLYRLLELSLAPYAGDLPLLFTGGCALNIKWNSRLRASGMFADVWVPPFPNDSGSALGAAAAHVYQQGASSMLWSVYAGPRLLPSDPAPGWRRGFCTVRQLASHLHRTGDPVVVLYGQAEIGPRALGHRSIIAPATDGEMHGYLNALKLREQFRPVAPICLQAAAPDIFDPGTPDPYMLFDHQIRPAWRERIPAVMHADGSARLQTVSPDDHLMHDLLAEYALLSGVPVLCNTSANFSGCGFFPDAGSAMRWGGTAAVWDTGLLYTRG